MSVIFSLFLWILWDVAFSVYTEIEVHKLSPPEWILAGSGVIFAVLALIFEFREREKQATSTSTTSEAHLRDMGQLKEQLARSSGFNEGAFLRVGRKLDEISAGASLQVREEVSRIKEEIQPRVALEFENREPCVVTSPTNLGRDQTFMRVLVKNVSGVTRCRGYLLRVRKFVDNDWRTIFEEGINLMWNYVASEPEIYVEPDIPRLLNVFAVDVVVNAIIPTTIGGPPIRLMNMLKENGLYRFDVATTYALMPLSLKIEVKDGKPDLSSVGTL